MHRFIRLFLLVALAGGLAYEFTWFAPSGTTEGAAMAADVQSQKVALHIDGMTCAACPVTIRKTLERLDGVAVARVSQKEERADVTYDPNKVTPQKMVQAIEAVGYDARILSE